MISKLLFLVLVVLASHRLLITTTALVTTTPSQFHTKTRKALTRVGVSKHHEQHNAALSIEKRTMDDRRDSSIMINDPQNPRTTTTPTTNTISSSSSSSSTMSRSRFLRLASASIVVASTTTTAAVTPTSASAAVLQQQQQQQQQLQSSLPRQSPITKKTSQTFQESISGFVAGGALSATKTVVKYPLDTATIRLQMPSSPYSLTSHPRALFAGSYRGILTPLLCNIPAGSVFFAVKDAVKQAANERGWSRVAATCLSVAVAQFPYWSLRNPSEVVKTRQQAGVYESLNTVEAFRMVYDEGVRRRRQEGGAAAPLSNLAPFYDGYVENILYAYPADVIKFVCYENFSKGRKNLPPLEGAIYGALATAVAQCVTTPLDVVRNRVMTGGPTTTTTAAAGAAATDGKDDSGSSGGSGGDGGYWEKLIKIAKEEGAKGLFAGVTPRVGKAVLSGAIQFATYEETKIKIGQFFERSSAK